MEPKGTKLVIIIFVLLGTVLLTQCGVRGAPTTDEIQVGPHKEYRKKSNQAEKSPSPTPEDAE